jgi:hypothetical protein
MFSFHFQDSKPPVLRRFNVHQSDGFLSNDNANILLPYDSSHSNNRRELPQKKEPSKHDLQDSLKITKNSQLQNPANERVFNVSLNLIFIFILLIDLNSSILYIE